MPVLNEERALQIVLPTLSATLRSRTIVVDNGSSDNSVQVALSWGVRVISESQRGYGAACQAGISTLAATRGDDVVLFMDGDASDDVADLPVVMQPILEGKADFVVGSRVLGQRERGALAPHARFGNALAVAMIRWLTGARYTDLGPLRAIRLDALRRLRMQDRNYGWTVEMQLKAAQQGLRIREVPVHYRRRIGRSKISGTLLGSLRAGLTIMRTIARYGR
ncbi:MAG TPA: glycosyltransferase family 2 protein [Longimicrobiales bacterium]|nr:glycosyltransferase family 2 protein [Longimicrobiales bacterium]